ERCTARPISPPPIEFPESCPVNKHASMNRAFRLAWNVALAAWIPAAETTRRRGKQATRAVRWLAPLVSAVVARQAYAAHPGGAIANVAALAPHPAAQAAGQQAYDPPAPTT